MRKTKYTKRSPVLLVFTILIVVGSSGLAVFGLFKAEDAEVKYFCIFWLASLFFSLFGSMIGTLSGRRKIRKQEKKVLKTNPYIYFRELPNDFGVGVTSLLMDSTLENYKDVVAVILDLCARKYLNLRKENNKYVVTILKDIDSGLLTNEKYILDLLKNNDIKNISYDVWYNHCVHDGCALNLFYHERIQIGSDYMPISEEKIKKRRTTRLIISLIMSLLMFLVELKVSVLEAVMNALTMFAICMLFLSILGAIINAILMFIYFAKSSGDISYQKTLNNNLTRTSVGVLEYQKLMSFKNFLNDFGSFASKNPEEIVLWDRYLSYAQVFGLTKKIMNSGYKQLVDNASFKIDDIDNITLENTEIINRI